MVGWCVSLRVLKGRHETNQPHLAADIGLQEAITGHPSREAAPAANLHKPQNI